jgi:phosphatidylglycerol:prolipoprotein diacylglycerol transferase
MHPILFHIPFIDFPIHTYGVMVALGFAAGMAYICFESKRLNQDQGLALDLVFWIIVYAIVGSRVFYVIFVEPSMITRNPLDLFLIWKGGLVFQGGLIFAVGYTIYFVRKHKLPLWTWLDMFAPAIPLGHIFGRIGCFMSGCCYGREAAHDLWCAVTFPHDPASFAPSGIPLYPTQLMESFGNIIVFLILFIFRRYKKFEGSVIGLYLVCYGILRFTIELFRGDERGFIMDHLVSTAQVISVATFIIGVVILLRNRKKFRLE